MTKINELLSNLKEDSFFDEVIELRQKIIEHGLNNFTHKLKINAIENQRSISDNFIIHNDEALYLSEESWNYITDIILKRKDLDSGNLINNTKNLNLDTKNLQLEIHKALTKIFIETNKLARIFIEMTLDLSSLTKLLVVLFQNIINSKLVKNEFNVDNINLKYTSLSYRIGKTLYHFYLSEHKIFHTINKALQLTGSLTAENISNLKEIVFNALQGANTQKIFKDLFEFNITNTTLIDISNSYILNIIFERYLENNVDFNDINSMLNLEFTEEKLHMEKHRVKEELTTFYVQLGSLIIDTLCKENICVQRTQIQKKPKNSYLVIEFKDVFLFKLLRPESYYRPILSTNIKKIDEQLLANKSTFILEVENTNHYIRSKKYISTHINRDSYITTHNLKILENRFSIDSYFLQYFLANFIFFQNKKFNFIKNKKNMFIFLSIYNIEFEDFYNKGASSDKIIIEKLIYFALNFSIDSDDILLNAIKLLELSWERKNLYKNIYYKIISYKFFLRGFLKESILYSIFGFFSVDSFIDSRGRSYLRGYYLNIQNFPLTKCLVKNYLPLSETNLIKNFNNIKDSFLNILKYDMSKTKLREISLHDYLKINQKQKNEYIYSFFDDKKLNLNKLEEILSKKNTSDLEILDFITSNIKNKNDIFNTYSYILHETKNKCSHISNIYGFDATTNGLQLISILFRDAELGEISNLTGTAKFDLYSAGSELCNNHLNQLEDILNIFKKTLGVNDDDIGYSNISLEALNFTQLGHLILSFDFFESLNIFEFVNILEQKLYPILIKNNVNIILTEELHWVLDSKNKTMYNEIVMSYPSLNKDFIKYIFVIKALNKLFYILNKHLWMRKNINRKTFKPAVMTHGYGATSHGRIDGFFNYFVEIAHDNHDWDVDKIDIRILANYLDNFFLVFKNKFMQTTELLKNISKLLGDMGKPLWIKTPYITMIFAPYELKEDKRITTRNRFGTREHQLRLAFPTENIEVPSFIRKFAPNLIHAMDATVVHIFREKMLYLNKSLSISNIPISYFTNHDHFSINYYPFLKLVVGDCYKELYDLNFLKYSLQDLEEKDPEMYSIVLGYIKTNKNVKFLTKDFENEFFITI